MFDALAAAANQDAFLTLTAHLDDMYQVLDTMMLMAVYMIKC